MSSVIRETYSRQQFSAVLPAGFSLASLFLAALGIYGLLAYSVTRRAREIGVRVALGALPAGIVRMVIADGARLVLCGAIAGLIGALLFSGMFRTLLFGVGPRDPLTLLPALAALILAALPAARIPARRAARVPPMEALRAE